MTEHELKKKIIGIVLDVPITGIKIREILGGEATANAISNALISAGIGDVSEYKHKAEVAERALDKATELAYTYRTQDDTLSCSSCPFFDSIFDRCKEQGLYEDCSKRWKEELLRQAEKELAEEGKDD